MESEFNNINLTTIKKFSLSGMFFYAKIIKVYDGDSITAVFRYNGEFYKWSCRLSGIDTPEIHSYNDNEKKLAIDARNYLRDNILEQIVKLECGDFDKYGRLLVIVYHNDINVNRVMIDKGYANVYSGGKKEEFNL